MQNKKNMFTLGRRNTYEELKSRTAGENGIKMCDDNLLMVNCVCLISCRCSVKKISSIYIGSIGIDRQVGWAITRGIFLDK